MIREKKKRRSKLIFQKLCVALNNQSIERVKLRVSHAVRFMSRQKPNWHFLSIICCVVALIPFSVQQFACPHRCQCYEDNEQKLQVHLICKWEQLNNTFLKLDRPDFVRTLTIRCPFHSPQVSTPSPRLFDGFVNLDRLEIDRCQIERMPESLFAGVGQLYSLILKNANITEMPREIFKHVPNLMTLDISGNRLKIEPYSLKSLHNLIYLDLSDNQIAFLTNTLVSLTKLKVITINNNHLTNIDFRRFPEGLTDLSIRHNLISNIHFFSASARNLRRLDLSGNRIEFISSLSSGNVNVLPSELRHVDLSGNRINFVQESAFSHLKNLILLDLKNNSIRELKYSSLRGSAHHLKLFLSDNLLSCHCINRWILNSKKKNITIADIQALQCSDVLDPTRKMFLSIADSRNQLLCKYSNMCEADCKCCEKINCDCRFQCPPSCKCLRSADTTSPRTSQNIMVCDNLRFDQIEVLPSPLTKLQLTNTDWKYFKTEKLSSLPWLKSLIISNSKMTVEEMQLLSNLKNLSHLEISSSSLTTIPLWISELPSLTHLYINSNPLLQLNSSSLAAVEKLKKIKIGGNLTHFSCDCESPSDLQRWLLSNSNRAKIEDLDEVLCDLKMSQIVKISETLPGTNESICVDPTEETKTWIGFVDNVQKSMMEREKLKMFNDDCGGGGGGVNASHGGCGDLPGKKKPENFNENDQFVDKIKKNQVDHESSLSTTKMTTKKKETTTQKSSASKNRRKFKDYENEEPHKFVNVLIFILFICVVILIISIGVTVYVKFLNPREAFKKRQTSGKNEQDQPLQQQQQQQNSQ